MNTIEKILNYALVLIPALPLLMAFLIWALGPVKEKVISRIALSTMAVYVILVFLTIIGVSWIGQSSIDIPLFTWGHETFGCLFFLDFGGCVFLGMMAFLGGTVVRFSQRYLHREEGYSRFFSTLLIFVGGMSILSLAHDLVTLFMGWEIVGISSFLLIGFYRHRSQPIRNAQKTYAVYRLCDVGLLVGALLEHKLMPGGTFTTLQNLGSSEFTGISQSLLFTLSVLILISASGKSAQFPFSFWLPRAMEGPTPSSAIFYGALSVHAGILLLYRTYGLWHSSHYAPYLIGAVGLVTSMFSTGMNRVQPTIKGQIAYASITQVGLMFFEMALGFPRLALFHFIANACLRCYQLLVSPSVVAYLLRRQSSTSGLEQIKFSDWSLERLLPNPVRSSLFCLVTLEGYLEIYIQRFLWKPAAGFGRTLVSNRMFFYSLAALLCMGIGWGIYQPSLKTLGVALLVFGLILSLEALVLTPNFTTVWFFCGVSSQLTALGIGVAAISLFHETLPFILGILGFFILGYLTLRSELKQKKLVIFLCLLGMTGFPLSPVFFGEDLLLDVAMHTSHSFAIIFTVGFIINGIALMRAYSNEFLNPERRLV